MTNAPDFLNLSNGTKLAYRKVKGKSPTIIWCGGLKSDMEGSKATFLENWAKQTEHAYIRFDYFGHGLSDGEFTQGTISRWASDTVSILDELTEGECILVGSSMGGWAGLLAALDRKDRVAAMVFVNPAPDFTEKLAYASWTDGQKADLVEKGVVYEPSGYEEPYAYSKELIEDGRARQILDAPIALKCPIRILQGAEDTVVPPKHSQRIVNAIESEDVTYTLVKGGDHSLSREQDLKLLSVTLSGLLD